MVCLSFILNNMSNIDMIQVSLLDLVAVRIHLPHLQTLYKLLFFRCNFVLSCRYDLAMDRQLVPLAQFLQTKMPWQRSPYQRLGSEAPCLFVAILSFGVILQFA